MRAALDVIMGRMDDTEYKRRFAEDRIAWYREMREKAASQLARIEEDGWRFFHGTSAEKMTDVTDDMASRERETIAMMDRLIEVHERDLG